MRQSLTAILTGRLPLYQYGVNSEFKQFIYYFLPKDAAANRGAMTNAVRHLHLAFKGMDAGEIYDVLMEQMLAVLDLYDPDYVQKVKRLAEAIDHAQKQLQFSAAELGGRVGFDCARHLKLLGRHGFLTPVFGKDKRIAAYRRSSVWPPPAGFFEKGPIKLADYLPKWFRYNVRP